MKLLEYKGKELLESYGIPIKDGVVVDSVDEVEAAVKKIPPPYVLKAQVAAGGRGKVGGIRFAEDRSGAKKLAGNILGMTIKDNIVKKLLISEKVVVKDEWYLTLQRDIYN